MKAQKITITEYAKIRKVTTQAIRKAISKRHRLPGVAKVELFGKTYVLTYKPE